MPWSTLFSRRIVFDSIELDGWNMVVEMLPDGTHSFIKLPERNGPRSAWTTTLQYVRARNGETTYRDHGTPWSVVTRNLDVSIARTDNRYVGRASFRGGTVAIQSYLPFDLDMASHFTIEEGRLLFDRIDVRTEGTTTRLRRRRQPGALARADVPDAVHGGLSVDAEDLLRQRIVRAVGEGRVPRHVPLVSRSRARRPQPDRPRAEGHVHEPGRRPEHAALRRLEGRGEVGAGVGAGLRHHDVVLRRHDEAGLRHGPVRRSRARRPSTRCRPTTRTWTCRGSRTTSRPRGCAWRAGPRDAPCWTGPAAALPIASARGDCW